MSQCFLGEGIQMTSCSQQYPHPSRYETDVFLQLKRSGVAHQRLHHDLKRALFSHDSFHCVSELVELESFSLCDRHFTSNHDEIISEGGRLSWDESLLPAASALLPAIGCHSAN